MPRFKHHLPELDILRPKNSTQTDDEWLIFDLQNVEVRARSGALTSLLRAAPKYPVTITGELVAKGAGTKVKSAIQPEHRQSSNPIPIVVKDCTYFAYGAFDNGDIAIWAAGQAGWHQIRPGESYVEIFQEMTEAVNILYYLIDSHAGDSKPEAKQIFSNYAKIHKLRMAAAVEKFYPHADFLASRMLRKEEDIAWEQTPIFRHMQEIRPDAFGATQQPVVAATSRRPSTVRSQTRETRPSPQPTNTRSTRRPSRTATQTANSEVTKPALRKGSSTIIGSKGGLLLSEVNQDKAKKIWAFMQRQTNQTLPEISEMTIDTFARFLFQSYHFENEQEAANLLKYLGPDLVAMMTIPRGRSYDPWTELSIYDELLEAKLPPRTKAKLARFTLQLRDRPLPDDSEEAEESNSDLEVEIMTTREAAMRKRQQYRRRISALRPKSGSKYSGKATKWKGKAVARDEDDDEVMEDNTSTGVEDDAMLIDTPIKRKNLPEDDVDMELSPPHPFKRFTRSQGDQDPELEDLEFEVQQAKSTGLTIRRRMSISQDAGLDNDGNNSTANGHTPMLGLVSEIAPSTEANTPGDIWTCPHDGCVHKVYGASERASKELIRDHMLDHKEKQRVELLRGEEGKTQLPVHHLLKRIREMAERSETDLRTLDGGLQAFFPQSLERVL